ncbi:hypothetical protein [Streptomyces sp. NPDC087300]|uniref:hypothetical protein n=1 Tax=Streptomyces sp. NPDC087300 TaxID=3365780 RepID=UPI0037F4DB84
MTTADAPPKAAPAARPPGAPIGVMYAGLALTAVTAIAPLVDAATADTIAGHVRAAYPQWGPGPVGQDRTAITTYLAVTGGLGALLWLLTIRAVATGRRWARAAATAAWGAGVTVALVNLSAGGEQYKVIVPVGYGVLTLLPCVLGGAAVIRLWRRKGARTTALGHRPITRSLPARLAPRTDKDS